MSFRQKWAGVAAVGLSAAPLAALGVLLWGSVGSARRPQQPVPVEPVVQPIARPEPVTPPSLPRPQILNRQEFIEAARRAATTHASGAPEPASASLIGRRFIIRVPFACAAEGAASDPGLLTREPGAVSVRIAVRPLDWTAAFRPLPADGVGDPPAPSRSGAGTAALAPAEAQAEEPRDVEGFWIRRPWVDAEDCPGTSGVSGASTPETVGFAVFYPAQASRAGRSTAGVYEGTAPDDPAAPLSPADLRMVFAGRVTGYDNGRAFRCTSSGPDERPVCIARVELDSIAVERVGARSSLATWEVGHIDASER